jgi:hypothetical protein
VVPGPGSVERWRAETPIEVNQDNLKVIKE